MKIISGGQTGVDRAALDFAFKHNIPHGGWIPKGRIAEDGPLPERYQLKEMPTESYPKRTEQNVIDSDGTVIISHGVLTGGSANTAKMAKKHGRPWLHLDMKKTTVDEAAQRLGEWIAGNSYLTKKFILNKSIPYLKRNCSENANKRILPGACMIEDAQVIVHRLKPLDQVREWQFRLRTNIDHENSDLRYIYGSKQSIPVLEQPDTKIIVQAHHFYD